MNWIRSNLTLVFGGLIALASMGVSGQFLYSQIKYEQTAQERLDRGFRDLHRLKDHDPHPGDPELGIDNLSAIRKERKRIESELLAPLRQHFKSFDFPEGLNVSEFKQLLEQRLGVMRRMARASGTELPPEDPDYSFSFADSRKALSFENEERVVPEMTAQLIQLQELCQALFDAKVHRLNGVKRSNVAEEEEEDAGMYGGAAAVDEFADEEDEFGPLNDSKTVDPYVQMQQMEYLRMLQGQGQFGMRPSMPRASYIEEKKRVYEASGIVLYPFQLSFQCFSEELSDVMTNINRSEYFFRVKWLVVEHPQPELDHLGVHQTGMFPPPSGMMPSGSYSGSGGYQDPYGSGWGQGTGSAMGRGRFLKELEEKPLTVNMLVEVGSLLSRDQESGTNDGRYEQQQPRRY